MTVRRCLVSDVSPLVSLVISVPVLVSRVPVLVLVWVVWLCLVVSALTSLVPWECLTLNRDVRELIRELGVGVVGVLVGRWDGPLGSPRVLVTVVVVKLLRKLAPLPCEIRPFSFSPLTQPVIACPEIFSLDVTLCPATFTG